MRRYHIAVSVGFGLVLLWLFLNNFLSLAPTVEINENRSLAEWPDRPETAKELKHYPQALADYQQDHFAARNFMLGQYQKLRYQIWGSVSTDRVLMGADNWCYDSGYAMRDKRGFVSLTDEEQELLICELKARQEWCRRQGMEFVCVIVPNKHSVYPENLPPRAINSLQSTGLRGELMKKLENHPQLNVHDLMPDIFHAKPDYPQLYMKLDGHWNGHGAFVGHQSLMRYLQSRWPEVNYRSPRAEWFDPQTDTVSGVYREWAALESLPMDIQYNYREKEKHVEWLQPEGLQPEQQLGMAPNFEMRYRNVNPDNEQKVLFIRDSFSDLWCHTMGRSFEETVFIFEGWDYHMNTSILLAEQPDLVVLEIFESHLPHLLNEIEQHQLIPEQKYMENFLRHDPKERFKARSYASEHGLSLEAAITELARQRLANSDGQ